MKKEVYKKVNPPLNFWKSIKITFFCQESCSQIIFLLHKNVEIDDFFLGVSYWSTIKKTIFDLKNKLFDFINLKFFSNKIFSIF